MVRTYSFNPSTQSNIILNETNLPSSFSSINEKKQKLLESMYNSVIENAGHTPRQRKTQQQQQEYNQLIYLNNNNSPQINEQNSYLENSKKEQSPTGNNSNIVIEEEQTTLFGIRSVLINGQRFFQPLDLPNNQNKQTLPSTALILALNKNNKINSQIKEEKNLNNFIDERISEITQLNNISNQRMEEFNYNNFGINLNEQNNYLINKNNNLINKNNEDNNNDYDILPWAKGCPQPKSGQRGSKIWMEGNEILNKKGNKSPFEHSFAPTSSTSSWPPPLTENNLIEQNFQRSSLSINQLNNLSSAEKHRIELLNQIEENKRRRALEKQKEWEMEEKERLRDERWRERQRAEIEAERRAEREKVEAAERKALKLEAAQKATEQALREEAKRLAEIKELKRRKGSNYSDLRELNLNNSNKPRSRQITVRNQNINIQEKNEINESEEEWWERKEKISAEKNELTNKNNYSSYNRQQSPIVPALRKKLENGEENNIIIKTKRSMSIGSRPNSTTSSRKSNNSSSNISSAFGRSSRLAYTPSIENKHLLKSKN